MTRYVKLRLAVGGKKIVSLFTQFFRALAVLARGSARAVRNVFCFKAADASLCKSEEKIKHEKGNEFTYLCRKVNAVWDEEKRKMIMLCDCD